MRSASLINIIQPDDIVLAEIAAGLNLDQLEGDLAVVGEAVHGTDRNIDSLILVHDALFLADGDFGGPAHHHPMFRAVPVFLQGQRAFFHGPRFV